MHDTGAALKSVRARIAELERRHRREPGSVSLLAVSKTKPPEAVRAAIAAGQHAFGENHLQDAMTKVEALAGQGRLVALHRCRPVEQDPADRDALRLGAQHREGEDRDPPFRPASCRQGAAPRMHRGQRERRGEQVGGVARGGSNPLPVWSASSPDCGCAASWPSRARRRASRLSASPSAGSASYWTTSTPRVLGLDTLSMGHDRRPGGGGGGGGHDRAGRDRDIWAAVGSEETAYAAT